MNTPRFQFFLVRRRTPITSSAVELDQPVAAHLAPHQALTNRTSQCLPARCSAKLLPIMPVGPAMSVREVMDDPLKPVTPAMTATLGLEGLQNLDGLRRLGTDRVVPVHIGRTNNPFLVDHVPRWHRQSVF